MMSRASFLANRRFADSVNGIPCLRLREKTCYDDSVGQSLVGKVDPPQLANQS